jgi:uncharacterized membrane protein
MSWIYFAVSAYLLMAVTAVVDKFLVSKVVKQPVAYAFYIGITGPFSLLLFPFGGQMLSMPDMMLALASGVFFVLGVYFYFSAVQNSSVSRVLPIQGGLLPLFTLMFAFILLNERLEVSQYFAFSFLVAGSVLISLRKDAGHWHPQALGFVTLSAICFALATTLSKHVFEVSNFITGMIWTRQGFVLVALALLLSAENRKHIFNAPKEAKAKNIFLYYSGRFSGTIAGFLQNYAVAIGSVTIVNAMQGTQFLFLLVLTTFLSFRYPKILKEKVNAKIMIQKISAIALISIGLFLLTQ